jgi:hypothetical protein
MTENVIQLHKDLPPDAYQDAQDAHRFTEGARDTLTETVIDVVQDAVPRPVDPPVVQAPPGTWVAERQAYLADAPPVVPTFLRNAAEFVNAARWTASYYGHVTAFHAIRLPVYALRLLTRAPRGLARMVLRWGKWVADTEARPVEAKAAASADIEAWLTLSREHSRRVRPRRIVSLAVATTTGITTLVGCFLAPGWTLTAMLAAPPSSASTARSATGSRWSPATSPPTSCAASTPPRCSTPSPPSASRARRAARASSSPPRSCATAPAGAPRSTCRPASRPPPSWRSAPPSPPPCAAPSAPCGRPSTAPPTPAASSSGSPSATPPRPAASCGPS